MLRTLGRWLAPPAPEDAHHDGHTPFYEGWYARVTEPETGESFALIYGVTNPGTLSGFSGPGGPGCCYLLVLHGSEAERLYQSFPLSEFVAQRQGIDVKMGPGRFTPELVSGTIESAEGDVAWSLNIAPGMCWPGRVWSSPMSIALHLPGIETYWHPVFVETMASGWIDWKGKRYEFTNTPAYTEKVWGRVFPQRWYWMQAQGFDVPGFHLCASGGRVPLPGLSGLPWQPEMGVLGCHDGEEFHAFISHHGARFQADYQPGHWQIQATLPHKRIEVDIQCEPHQLVALEGPTMDGVAPVALEALTANAEVRLFRRQHPLQTWRLHRRAISHVAGAEVGGLDWVKAHQH